MPVSDAVRERVKNRLEGACYFFHDRPVQGTQIVHLKHHQGMGGLPPEHEYNQEENLAWGCQECHNLFHIPEGAEEARHAGTVFKVKDFRLPSKLDPFDRAMEILDTNGNVIDPVETPIWYLIEPHYSEGKERRVQLEAAVRTLFASMFEVAQGFEYFRDYHARKDQAWRRFMVFNDEGGTELRRWEDLPPLLNFTVTDANRYERQARWATESNSIDLVRGMSIKAINALRQITDEAKLVELAGIARDGKPTEFWGALDEEVEKRERMNRYELVRGSLRIVRGTDKDGTLYDADGKEIQIHPDERIIIKKGTILRGGGKIEEEEDKLEGESDGR